MKLDRTRKKIKGYLNLCAAFIVVCSVCTYALVDYINNYVIQNNYNYNYEPIYAIGMIVPMSIIITFICYFFLKGALKRITILIQGIERISNKDYNTKIISNKKDPIYEVYEVFNKMSDDLNSVQILRNDFISNFSHEFKTPISSIHGFSEVLLEENLSKEEQIKYLEIIRDESERLTNLAEKVMLMSRLNTENIEMEKEKYYLNHQIKDTIILLQKLWEEKNIKMVIHLEKNEYYGHKELMREVWINLINNAIKYIDNGGIIEITLRKIKDKIIFTIKDNGIGIEEDKVKYIFDEYYQADLSHHNKGVGLGLSIVKKILDLEEANIEVKSELGKYTIFKVIL